MAGLGSLLRRYREAAGLSQEELAERAGLSARGVSDLERGLRHSPYPATMRRLALALGLAPEDRAALLAAVHTAPDDQAHTRSAVVEQGAYLGARASTDLVGRGRELAELRQAVADALSGTGRLVLLAGEAGIGKTRLAQELAAIAAPRGFLVATGRCYEPYQTVALYPWLDALGELYALAPVDIRQALPERWPYVERLLPDAFPHASGGASDSPDELLRLWRSAAGFVRACAERTPVALLIDDLQWADRASVDLLQHLVRHTRGQAVLIGATVRDPVHSASSSLRHAINDLRREGLLQHMRLGRLERAETAMLLAKGLGSGQPADQLIDLIQCVSAGNPFFAIEVLQTLRTRGELVLAGSQWIGRVAGQVAVPESVRDSILERYTRLSDIAKVAIEAAAVLGQDFMLDQLAAVVAFDPEVTDTALQEAVAVGFIRVPVRADDGAADRYGFVHALTQQALYEHLSAHRRRRLHLRAAEILEALPEQVRTRRAAEIAQHFQAANEAARALPYLVLAGDQAEALFAHEDARQHYQAAASVAAATGDRAAEARALVGLGRSWLAGGHPERALQYFESAVRIYRALEDPEGEGETLARIAQVYFARGNWDAGIERLPALIEGLERRAPSRALALLYMCLAAVMPAKPSERIGAATRASELARVLGDEDLLIQAEANRGFVLMLAGQLPAASVSLEAILPRAEARRTSDALPMILGSLAEITKLHGDLRGYLGLAEREVALAEERGEAVTLVGALSGLAEAQFLLGNWPAARRTYERAGHEGADVDAAWYRGFIQLGLAAIDVAEGNWTSVEQQLADCLFEGPRLGHHNRREHALRLLARRDLLAGDPANALARLAEVVRAEGDDHAGTQTLRAWALLESGDLMSATEAVARAIELASGQRNQLDLSEALLIRAELDRLRGDLDSARSSLSDALVMARAMPCPYLEARVRYAQARMMSGLDNSSDAEAELRHAIAMFENLGAEPYVQKAKRLLGTRSHDAR